MKPISLFLFFNLLLLSVFVYGQINYDYTKCSQRLIDEIDRANQHTLKVRIMLADQVDIRDLDKSLYSQNASLQERAEEVIGQLRSRAGETQSYIVDDLMQIDDFQVESLRLLWIVNALIAIVPADALRALTYHPDVTYLDLETKPVLDHFERSKPVAEYEKSVNGIEPGLAAVNATGMWDLGYTGYGHWALILDTGTDGFHPSLIYNFQGLYTPVEQSWLVDNGIDYPYDCGSNGHGTHVAGTTLGLDRLTNDTIGVAFNGNWMASPAISCPEVELSNLEILQWALDPDGNPATTEDMPTVINNSWRDPTADDCDPLYEMALTTLEAAGIAVVFSAGNSGPDASTITDPKNLNTDLVNSFAVGSVNGNMATLPISTSSSRGPSVCGQTGSLLIKPEVSAPGVSVRSSLPDGNYDFYSGTSMAAPHVSGSVLLLKEAFPGLTGTELKLALYHSAVDLGDPGEDNTYGMGIIDVVAAFDYLVNEGHTPFDPSVVKDALVVGLPGFEGLECGDLLSPELIIENSGQESITSMDIDFWYDSGTPEQMNWSGVLDPGTRINLSLPGMIKPSGPHELRVEIVAVNGSPDDRYYNNRGIKKIRWIQDFPVAVASTDPVCDEGAAYVEILDEFEVLPFWYSTLESDIPSDTGTTYISPDLTEDTTVYFDVRLGRQGGPFDFSIGPTQTNDDLNNYLVFDAAHSFVLKSVKVFANSVGGRLVELRGSDGFVIASKPFGLTPGEHRLELDFKVPAGEDFRLGIAFTADMTFNFFGAQFPYNIDDVVSIKGTNNGVNSNAYYYYYDWEIEYGFPCGRKPVNLTATDEIVQADFTPSATTVDLANNTVSFQNTSSGASSYFWDFGDGSTSEMLSPDHAYLSPGIYQVVMVATGPEGCNDVSSVVIEVLITTATEEIFHNGFEVNLYPNPTDGIFFLDIQSSEPLPVEVEIFDLLGRNVISLKNGMTESPSMLIDLNGFPAGLYLVKLRKGDHIVTKKMFRE